VSSELRDSEVRRAWRVAGELADVRELDAFPGVAAQTLRTIIPCDLAGFNAIGPGSGHAAVAADPADCVFDGGAGLLARFIHENPMLVHVAHKGDTSALRLSDFISRRALHRTSLYEYVYRRIPQEYQLGLMLPSRGVGRSVQIVALSLGRTHRDFTDRHLRLLDATSSVYTSTLNRLQDIAFLHAAGATNSHADDIVVLIDRSGVVARASAAAGDALGLVVGEPLPPHLMAAMRRARAAGDATWLASPGGLRLRIRVTREVYPALDALHAVVVGEEVRPEQLRSLGLTRRQAEVLALTANGQTAAQVAAALSLSSRTVEKHLASIYDRLGVSNRGAAIAAALRSALRGSSDK
jgi:DNA-binding CsgD family transcriptional regulator